MRTVLFLIALSACSSSTPPRNLVCERVSVLSPKAECIPEMSDAGDAHAHTARVTVEQDGKKSTVACGLTVGQLAMVCDVLQAQPKPVEAPKQ